MGFTINKILLRPEAFFFVVLPGNVLFWVSAVIVYPGTNFLVGNSDCIVDETMDFVKVTIESSCIVFNIVFLGWVCIDNEGG